MTLRVWGRLAAAVVVAIAATPFANTKATKVAAFYRGRTIRLVVGAPAGGGYDRVARLIATRFGAHVPGRPRVIVQNLGGAGGLVMANALYNSMPRDGTVIGLPPSAVPLEPRLKLLTHSGGAAKFQVAKFGWLGSAAQQPQVMFFWSKAGVDKLADLKRKPVLFGAIMGSDSYWLPLIMNSIMGWKLNIVTGYQGFGDILLAMERGEIVGHSAVYANLTAAKPDWLRDKKVNILLQFGLKRIAALANTPTAIEIAPDKADRAMLRFFALKYSMAYSLIAPPGVPAARLAALRAAFSATMKDPAYIAGARKIALPLNSISGREELRLIAQIDATPDSVVKKLRAIMNAAARK